MPSSTSTSIPLTEDPEVEDEHEGEEEEQQAELYEQPETRNNMLVTFCFFHFIQLDYL